MAVYVGPRGEQNRRRAHVLGEVPCERCKQIRGLPRKCRKRLGVELRPADPNQISAILIRRGTKDGRARFKAIHNGVPINLVQARAVIPHRDDMGVPLRKRIGEGVGQARSEVIAALPDIGDFEDGKSARFRRAQRMLIERIGHLPAFRVVVPYKLFILPLALGAMAEKQDGGMGARLVNGSQSLRKLAMHRGLEVIGHGSLVTGHWSLEKRHSMTID